MEEYHEQGFGKLCCAVNVAILLVRYIESKDLYSCNAAMSCKQIVKELNKLPLGNMNQA